MKIKERLATTINEHVRIIAGAGSGKTRVLMARIVYLVQDCGILPNRILAITFTNKAANEMKTRLTAQLGSMANVVRISTIHSLCVRMLSRRCGFDWVSKNIRNYGSRRSKGYFKTNL